MPSILDRLGSLFVRQYGGPSPATREAPTTPAGAGGPSAQAGAPGTTTTAGGAVATAGAAPEQSDPIVAQVHQELASEQPQPVPTEEQQLVDESHGAWAAYDFERCIVIFSRLREVHPEDESYREKLVASYYNRGKQCEAEGNDRRATQLYYAALAVDPDFPPAREAAEQLLAKHGEPGATTA
jgi:hypothetical protein